jgi:hypothetical protein
VIPTYWLGKISGVTFCVGTGFTEFASFSFLCAMRVFSDDRKTSYRIREIYGGKVCKEQLLLSLLKVTNI